MFTRTDERTCGTSTYRQALLSAMRVHLPGPLFSDEPGVPIKTSGGGPLVCGDGGFPGLVDGIRVWGDPPGSLF